jgi:tyrosyl-tRNA synthetase
MTDMNVKIVVATHKAYPMPSDDMYLPVQAGAALLGEEKVTDVNAVVTRDLIGSDGLLMRKGKKSYVRLTLA